MENAPADLEQEMLKRGMLFEVIDWSEDQATLPFDAGSGSRRTSC